MLNFSKYISKSLLILSFLLLLPASVFAIDTSLPTITNPFDTMQVSIPGMKRFSDATVNGSGANTSLTVNWIGEYIMGVYTYGISVIGVLAVLAIAIGGVMWIMSFGNPSMVAVGKEWIVSAILGLVLALGSYILLNTINADLVRMRPIQLNYVEKIDDPGDASATNIINSKTGFPDNVKPCPPDSSSLQAVVNYYLTQKRLSYDKAKRAIYPDFSDCSDFASQLAKCAGLKPVPGEGTTQGLFIDATNNRQRLSQGTNLDSILKPGDMVGYNNGRGTGHVLTYLGGGQLIECGGEVNSSFIIRQSGCVRVTNYKNRLSVYFNQNVPLYYIKR